MLFVCPRHINLFYGCLSNGSDTISTGQSLFPNQTIISKEGKFELGFFAPGNSSNYYVGIWYKNISVRKVVWVANRNNPIPLSFNNSRLEMSNGNLNLIVNSKRIWMLAGSSNATEAVILDTGNFVLRNASDIIWQSFDYPTERLPNTSAGGDLYIRTESVEHPGNGKRNLLLVNLVALVVPITAAIFISCFCFCCRWRKLKRKESSEAAHQNILLLDLNSKFQAYSKRTSVRNSHEEEENNHHELPIFSFYSIAASTNNFSITNKLGEGGFGPVYKGVILNGQFVAVKRLSKRSGQGLEEFKNEIELIAKLQHKNLVGILGCCIENEEKILVYEYMPNKSLDFFLFEATGKEQLDWRKRVHIIKGIAQGLLYLHHHSPLRIVHRDLKASNILLDAEMNPKISDFGMARIFGGNDSQANTKRIVGTYGYMPPEYAMEELLSVKSDVFDFGVLMLEIISGKKNTGFYGSNCLSLLGYAWNLWNHERVLELIDPTLDIPGSSFCIPLRYIQIVLLCVQESPAGRPLMSDVIAMLNNEETTIESPKYPAFNVGRTLAKASPEEGKAQFCSIKGLIVSDMEAR